MLITALLLAGSAARKFTVDPNDPIASHPDMAALVDRIVENNARRGLDAASNSLSERDKQDIVALHNKVRSETARGQYQSKDGALPKAANMVKLKWSESLAFVATEWSSKCRLTHRSQSSDTDDHCDKALAKHHAISNLPGHTPGEGCGENIAALGVAPYWSYWATDAKTGKQRDFGIGGAIENGWSKDEARYAQVAWAETRFVGCGFADCSSAEGVEPSWMKTMLTCNYYPKVDHLQQGRGPYKVGEECSACPHDYSGCTDSRDVYTSQSVKTPSPTKWTLAGLCTDEPPPKKQAPSLSKPRCPRDKRRFAESYTMSGFDMNYEVSRDKSRYKLPVDVNSVYTWHSCQDGASKYDSGQGNVLFFGYQKHPIWAVRGRHGLLGHAVTRDSQSLLTATWQMVFVDAQWKSVTLPAPKGAAVQITNPVKVTSYLFVQVLSVANLA